MNNEHLTEDELIERFDNHLNEFNTVSVSVVGEGLNLLPSRVIKLADPVAYRTGLSNYADFLERSEGITTEGYTS